MPDGSRGGSAMILIRDMIEKTGITGIVDAEGIVLSGKNKNHIGLLLPENDIALSRTGRPCWLRYGISKGHR